VNTFHALGQADSQAAMASCRIVLPSLIAQDKYAGWSLSFSSINILFFILFCSYFLFLSFFSF
jgi:hypothetical protein